MVPGEEVLKVLGKNAQTIEPCLRDGIEISPLQQTNIEASRLTNITATSYQCGSSEPQNDSSAKELSEVCPLLNTAKASDARPKVCNCD